MPRARTPDNKNTSTKKVYSFGNSLSSSDLLKKLTLNNIMYGALLISFLLNGYFFARVQASGQPLLLGGVFMNTKPQTGNTATGNTTSQPNNRENITVGVGHLPTLGNKDAKVTIVEFSDLQCPFCRRFYTEAFQKIKKDYLDTGKAKLYFRHYPLDFHPQAPASALAVECANDQGKFWELHDKIYEEQEKKGSSTTIQFTDDDIKIWAGEIGLSMTTFTTCFDSKKHEDLVKKDTTDGSSVGVSGTPTFFINGTELVGAQPYEAFKDLIDRKLQE